jgi:hypothetical protein
MDGIESARREAPKGDKFYEPPEIDDYRDDHKDHSFRYGGRDYVDLQDPDRAFCTIQATVNEIGKVLNPVPLCHRARRDQLLRNATTKSRPSAARCSAVSPHPRS